MSKVQTLSEDSFETTINSSETVMVDFGATWCRPCKTLEPIIDEISEEVDCPVFKVDIDDSPDVTQKYGIKSVPTVIVFKDGKVHKTSLGVTSKAKLLELLK